MSWNLSLLNLVLYLVVSEILVIAITSLQVNTNIDNVTQAYLLVDWGGVEHPLYILVNMVQLKVHHSLKHN